MKTFQKAFDLSPAQDYLQSRGISPETAKAFGCGYAEKWEHWEKDKTGSWQILGTDQRVVFPVTDQSGNVIAFHGRTIGEPFGNFSSKLSKGDKSQGLFQTSDTLEADVVTIVEGPIDAMALYQCGMTAGALVGTSAGDWITSALAFRKVFVGLDADESGDEGSDILISVLRSRGARAVRLRPTDCNDWGEFLEKFGADALRDFINEHQTAAFSIGIDSITPAGVISSTAEDFTIYNVFSEENETGQAVIDYLFKREPMILTQPTVAAYQTELALVKGIDKKSKGELSERELNQLINGYIDAHSRSEYVSGEWTGADVLLFCITLKLDGKHKDEFTCNQIQSWIIREFWLREFAEAEVGIIGL